MNKLVDKNINITSNNKNILISVNKKSYCNLDLALNAQNIQIVINENSTLNLYEFLDKNIVEKTTVYLKRNAKLNWSRFFNNISNNQSIIIYLEEENSKVKTCYSLVGNKNQSINIKVIHKANKTISDISNYAVESKSGSLDLTVTSIIENNIKDTIVNQDSKIILLDTNKRSLIKPEIIVGNYLVDAKHSAFIGKFDKSIIFYMQTRGLSINKIYNLLINGFLLNYLMISEFEKENLKLLLKDLGGVYE